MTISDDAEFSSRRHQVPCADFGRVTVYFGAKNGKYPDGNQVVVRGTDTQAAFDTPLVSNRIGPDFDRTELVVLGHVHEDHVAGLHRLPNTDVHVHEADLPAMRSWKGILAAYGTSSAYHDALLHRIQGDFFYTPRPDAIGYSDGAVWDLGQTRVRAIHMPGHTAGHTVLLVEPEGVAFIGDIDLSSFGPYYGDASSNLGEFRRSLLRLPEIPARVWITFHHRGVYTDRDRFLRDLRAYSDKITEREDRLVASLSQSPKTLRQLVEGGLLYPPGYLEPWVADAETRTISQHLNELLAGRRVRLDEEGAYHLG